MSGRVGRLGTYHITEVLKWRAGTRRWAGLWPGGRVATGMVKHVEDDGGKKEREGK